MLAAGCSGSRGLWYRSITNGCVDVLMMMMMMMMIMASFCETPRHSGSCNNFSCLATLKMFDDDDNDNGLIVGEINECGRIPTFLTWGALAQKYVNYCSEGFMFYYFYRLFYCPVAFVNF